MDEDLIVSTKQGKLYGSKTTTALHKTPCYSFCGIPYAKPPLDTLRFMPPEPYEKWRGLLNATKEKDDCLQFSHFFNMYVGSEDCLYLNVHCPEPPRKIKKPKPVMILIHPGGNAWGSGSRDGLGNPDFLVPNDVILVTFNFRLHVFGFLSLGIPHCSGNMGLKDQVMVFRWVQENISSFGGDPNNVTLTGCSAASCDVHFHLMSPLSKGLFHRVIMQSGFAGNSNWSYITPELSYERAVILAHELGFKGGTTARKICSFLKTKTAMELTEGVGKLKSHIKNTNPEKYEAVQFLPTAESVTEGAFLTALPRDLMYSVEPIPIVCSMVRKEGLIAFCTKPIDTVRGNLEKVVRDGLSLYNIDDKTLKYLTRKIRNFYFGNREINDDVLEDIVNLFTDLWFCEWYEMINYMATLPGAQPIYVYEFAFYGKFNYQRRAYAENAPDWLIGACHADDTSYVTYYKAMVELFREQAVFEERETKVIKNLNILLTNFAKTGDPNGGTSDEIVWKPHYPDDPSHVVVDDNLTVINSRVNEERFKFWDEMIKVIKDCEKRLKENSNPTP